MRIASGRIDMDARLRDVERDEELIAFDETRLSRTERMRISVQAGLFPAVDRSGFRLRPAQVGMRQ